MIEDTQTVQTDPFEDNQQIHEASNRAQRFILPNENPAPLLSESTEPNPSRRRRRNTIIAAGSAAVVGLAGVSVVGANVINDTMEAISNPHNHENMQVVDSIAVYPGSENGDLLTGVEEGVAALMDAHDLEEGTIPYEAIQSRSTIAGEEYLKTHGQPITAGTSFTLELLESTSTDGDPSYEIDVLPPEK